MMKRYNSKTRYYGNFSRFFYTLGVVFTTVYAFVILIILIALYVIVSYDFKSPKAMIVFGAYTVISYILESSVLYKIYKTYDLPSRSPMLAWLPFWNKFMLGKISQNGRFGAAVGIFDAAVCLMTVIFVAAGLEYVLLGLLVAALLLVSFALEMGVYSLTFDALVEEPYSFTMGNLLTVGVFRQIILLRLL